MWRLFQKTNNGIVIGLDLKDYGEGSTGNFQFSDGSHYWVSSGNGAVYPAEDSAVGQAGPGDGTP